MPRATASLMEKKVPVKRKHDDLGERNGDVKSQKKLSKVNGESSTQDSNMASQKSSSQQSSGNKVMWVDKYKPTLSKQIIGQHGPKSSANKLAHWLNHWFENLDKKPGFGRFANEDGAGFRAALLSGNPGVGKTTTAQVICKETGYEFIEMNASDKRNKKSLTEEVASLLHNQTLTNYFSATYTKSQSGLSTKHVLIMDEVDGMSGNEDRGGIAELILLIKKSKIPIICICNDRSHPKMRSLVNYCFDLRMYKPRGEQIKAAMMSIAYKEGLKITSDAMGEIIESSNQDIRQVLHYMSLLAVSDEKIEHMKTKQPIKDVKLGIFDALKKVFSSGPDVEEMNFNGRSSLFFSDYSLMPLFVFENYLHVAPNSAKGKEVEKLKCVTRSIDAMVVGDIIERQLRSSNNWGLLPMQAAFSTVMPSYYMSGRLCAMINFPALLGKISSTNRKDRLLQDLKVHMALRTTGSKTSLNLDYLETLRNTLTRPLIAEGSDGVPKVLETMTHYCLRKEDVDNISELSLWADQKDPMSNVEPKTKAALTRAYNKKDPMLPYSTSDAGKKGRAKASQSEMGDEIEEDTEVVEEEEEKDTIEADGMIKKKEAKKTTKKSEDTSKKTKAAPKTTRGRGRGRGRGKK